jgi:DnaJ-class molecular chaperone
MGLTLAEANKLLGGPHSTQEAIRAAWRRAVKGDHPDLSTGDGHSLIQLSEARDLLLTRLNQGQEIPCKLCGGSGRVQTGFGATCAACKGTGQQNG